MSFPHISINIALPHSLIRTDVESTGVGIFSYFDLPDEICATWPLTSEARVTVFQTEQEFNHIEEKFVADLELSTPLALAAAQVHTSQETKFVGKTFILALGCCRDEIDIQTCFFEALKSIYDQGERNLIIGVACFSGVAGFYRIALALANLIDNWGNMLQSLCVAVHPSCDTELYRVFSRIFARFKPDKAARLLSNKPLRASVTAFDETLSQICATPLLNRSVCISRKNTLCYGSNVLLPNPLPRKRGQVSLTDMRTLDAAEVLKRDYPNSRVCVLNFADPIEPGGGINVGSWGQEESLCRCTTLFPCLEFIVCHEHYYNHHDRRNPRGSDACIYTPDVTVFRTDENIPQSLPEDKWWQCDIISCAAPRLRDGFVLSDREIEGIHQTRVLNVLSVCMNQNVDSLVLGAFGCGAFHNPPEKVAKAFSTLIETYRYCFEHVVFAIHATVNRDNKNYICFKQALTTLL